MEKNKITCWYCDTTSEYEGEKYRDINCPCCGVLNSVYDPSKYVPMTETELNAMDLITQQKEEEMLNYGDDKYQGKFVYLPRVGETAEFEIKELKEVKGDNPKFNFSENVPVLINGEPAIDDDGEPVTKKKDLGYHIEAELTNGKILSVTSIAAFINVFKKYEINDGDKVRIVHKDKGVWEVEKL